MTLIINIFWDLILHFEFYQIIRNKFCTKYLLYRWTIFRIFF